MALASGQRRSQLIGSDAPLRSIPGLATRLVVLAAVLLTGTNSPAAAGGQLGASPPTPVFITAEPTSIAVDEGSLGRATIGWNAGGEKDAVVYVRRDEGEERLFAKAASGSAVVDWIAPGARYHFTLYTASEPRIRLAEAVVAGVKKDVAPELVAEPNPVPGGFGVGRTELHWKATGSNVRIEVSVDGGTPALLATGSSGSVVVPWIRSGSQYEFMLLADDAEAPRRLRAVVVRREGLPLRRWIGMGLVVVAVLLAATGLLLKSAGDSPLSGPTGWWLESSIVLTFVGALCAKMVYAARLIQPYESEQRIVVVSALAAGLSFSAPWLLLPRYWRWVGLLSLDAAISAVLLADELYFRRYAELVSAADVPSAPVLLEDFARPVVLGLLTGRDAVYGIMSVSALVLFPFLALKARLQRDIPFRVRWRAALTFAVAGTVTALPAASLLARYRSEMPDAGRAYRSEIAGNTGPVPYHLYELIVRATGTTDATLDIQQIVDTLRERQKLESRSSLFGVARNANLILIQAESLERFPLELTVDGQAVAPNLAAFADESLDFRRFFDQTYRGFTSDGEFTSLTSLHPLPAGAASVRMRNNHFRSLPSVLRAHGYATMSACVAGGETWSMAMMHPNHGFDLSVFEEHFEDGERFDLLSDGAFFSQTIPRLRRLPRPFMAFLVTSSNHGPPFEAGRRYPNLRLPEALKNSVAGDYLQSVHYFDRVFGDFIAGLRSTGLLEESIVALYGDHKVNMSPSLFANGIGTGLVGGDPDTPVALWEVERRLPFLVRLPKKRHAAVYEAPAGHLDVAPTLLALLGIADPDRVMLGRDATSGPGMVVFRDGSFATEEYRYILPRVPPGRPACFATADGRELECSQVEPLRLRARQQLALSDTVLERDLIPQLTRGTLQKTLADLPSPGRYSYDLGTDEVVQTGFDLRTSAPSGPTFDVDVGEAGLELMFSPVVATGRTAHPVLYEVLAGGTPVFQEVVLPGALTARSVAVQGANPARKTRISLITRHPDGTTRGRFGSTATWRAVRFLASSPRLYARGGVNERPVIEW